MGLSASVFIWAGAYGGKGVIPFGALNEGELFSFPSGDSLFKKGRRGWYLDTVTGRKYRTNSKVAVVRKNKGETNVK